jgi:hypothetical protein
MRPKAIQPHAGSHRRFGRRTAQQKDITASLPAGRQEIGRAFILLLFFCTSKRKEDRAPRPLYVASAADDAWADPKGEFLSAKNAEPVYALFGKKGLGVVDMPAVDHPVGETIRYHIRTGKHDFTLYDWQQYLDFADKQFGKGRESN